MFLPDSITVARLRLTQNTCETMKMLPTFSVLRCLHLFKVVWTSLCFRINVCIETVCVAWHCQCEVIYCDNDTKEVRASSEEGKLDSGGPVVEDAIVFCQKSKSRTKFPRDIKQD